ncbi:MAG: hypothetical protein C0501_30080 [Isosphaera sp.]|nr:hypothetical protein [Isosphaera sp.]
MRALTVLGALFAAAAAAADEKDKPAIKEVSLADLKLAVAPPDKGRATEPAVVTAARDLVKVTPFTPGAMKAVEKQADFDKEKVVVFWWGGSGQDRVAAGELKTADGKTTATFTYTPGLTRDLRGHLRVFVVPKDAEVKVEPGKRK